MPFPLASVFPSIKWRELSPPASWRLWGLNNDDRNTTGKPAAFSPSSTRATSRTLQPVRMLPAGHIWSLCPPITGWKGQRAFLCPTLSAAYKGLTMQVLTEGSLVAIILFSAADMSPPFLNWEYSAAFSSAGSAISDRNEASRSYDLGNTAGGRWRLTCWDR